MGIVKCYYRSLPDYALLAEFCIWGIESLILYFYRYNQLKLGEAIALSLVMNLASFSIGWFIPM
jgi:hypothetical protein